MKTNHSTCFCKLYKFWFIATDCKDVSTSSWVVNFFSTKDNCNFIISELQEVFLIEFVEESTTMLHVFVWSFINQDKDRDAWLWLFTQAVSNQVTSPTAPSATECRLFSDLESAAMAVARPTAWQCLLQKRGRPLCCARCASSRAQCRRRPPTVAGSVSCCTEHHCLATAANQWQMHCTACHPPATEDGA